MTIVEDSILLLKKVAISIVIYLVPVTILVSGLLLTRYLLDGDSSKPNLSTTIKR